MTMGSDSNNNYRVHFVKADMRVQLQLHMMAEFVNVADISGELILSVSTTP